MNPWDKHENKCLVGCAVTIKTMNVDYKLLQILLTVQCTGRKNGLPSSNDTIWYTHLNMSVWIYCIIKQEMENKTSCEFQGQYSWHIVLKRLVQIDYRLDLGYFPKSDLSRKLKMFEVYSDVWKKHFYTPNRNEKVSPHMPIENEN